MQFPLMPMGFLTTGFCVCVYVRLLEDTGHIEHNLDNPIEC
jgi:hypothetical protein